MAGQTHRWEVKEIDSLGQLQESNVAPRSGDVVVIVNYHFFYGHFPGPSRQPGPIMDAQDQVEGAGWQGRLRLLVMDTVGSCEGPVGANLGGEVVMARKAGKVPTRLALQEESRGSWSPTRRRAIQGKESSWERG